MADENMTPLKDEGFEKRPKLKRIKKKKSKCDLNSSTNGKLFKSFSSRMNISVANSSVMKASLRANNKALAQSLEKVRGDLRMACELNNELKKDIQELHLRNLNLERVAGLKDDGLEKEVQRRMEDRGTQLKQLLSVVSIHLLDAGSGLQDALDVCNHPTRLSLTSSTRSSLVPGSETESPLNSAPPPRSIYWNANKFARVSSGDPATEVAGPAAIDTTEPVTSSVPAAQVQEMTMILEQSVMLDEHVEGVAENLLAVPEDPSKVDEDPEVPMSPPKVKSKRSKTKSKDDLKNSPKQSEVISSTEMCDRRGTFVVPFRSPDKESSPYSRRGTFVVPAAPRQRETTSIDQSEKRDRRETFILPKPTESENKDKGKTTNRETFVMPRSPTPKLSSSKEIENKDKGKTTKRETFVMSRSPAPKMSNSKEDSGVKPSLPLPVCSNDDALVGEDATIYFNTDMELTGVVNVQQLFASTSGETENVEANDNKSSSETSFPRPLVKVSKSSSLTSVSSKDKTDLKASKSDSDVHKEGLSKPSVHLQLRKPGKIVFTAVRKGTDGSRPSKLPQRSRSKSKKAVKELAEAMAAHEPQNIFDFHDKTPHHLGEKSKVEPSVYDISVNESSTQGEQMAEKFTSKSKKDGDAKCDSVTRTYKMPLKGSPDDKKTTARSRSKSRGRSRSKSRTRRQEDEENNEEDECPSRSRSRSKRSNYCSKPADDSEPEADLQRSRSRSKKGQKLDIESEPVVNEVENVGRRVRSRRKKSTASASDDVIPCVETNAASKEKTEAQGLATPVDTEARIISESDDNFKDSKRSKTTRSRCRKGSNKTESDEEEGYTTDSKTYPPALSAIGTRPSRAAKTQAMSKNMLEDSLEDVQSNVPDVSNSTDVEMVDDNFSEVGLVSSEGHASSVDTEARIISESDDNFKDSKRSRNKRSKRRKGGNKTESDEEEGYTTDNKTYPPALSTIGTRPSRAAKTQAMSKNMLEDSLEDVQSNVPDVSNSTDVEMVDDNFSEVGPVSSEGLASSVDTEARIISESDDNFKDSKRSRNIRSKRRKGGNKTESDEEEGYTTDNKTYPPALSTIGTRPSRAAKTQAMSKNMSEESFGDAQSNVLDLSNSTDDKMVDESFSEVGPVSSKDLIAKPTGEKSSNRKAAKEKKNMRVIPSDTEDDDGPVDRQRTRNRKNVKKLVSSSEEENTDDEDRAFVVPASDEDVKIENDHEAQKPHPSDDVSDAKKVFSPKKGTAEKLNLEKTASQDNSEGEKCKTKVNKEKRDEAVIYSLPLKGSPKPRGRPHKPEDNDRSRSKSRKRVVHEVQKPHPADDVSNAKRVFSPEKGTAEKLNLEKTASEDNSEGEKCKTKVNKEKKDEAVIYSLPLKGSPKRRGRPCKPKDNDRARSKSRKRVDVKEIFQAFDEVDDPEHSLRLNAICKNDSVVIAEVIRHALKSNSEAALQDKTSIEDLEEELNTMSPDESPQPNKRSKQRARSRSRGRSRSKKKTIANSEDEFRDAQTQKSKSKQEDKGANGNTYSLPLKGSPDSAKKKPLQRGRSRSCKRKPDSEKCTEDPESQEKGVYSLPLKGSPDEVKKVSSRSKSQSRSQRSRSQSRKRVADMEEQSSDDIKDGDRKESLKITVDVSSPAGARSIKKVKQGRADPDKDLHSEGKEDNNETKSINNKTPNKQVEVKSVQSNKSGQKNNVLEKQSSKKNVDGDGTKRIPSSGSKSSKKKAEKSETTARSKASLQADRNEWFNEIKRKFSTLSRGSEQFSLASLEKENEGAGVKRKRETSEQNGDDVSEKRSRRAAAAAVSYKEPSVGGKLRRGDPGTSHFFSTDPLKMFKSPTKNQYYTEEQQPENREDTRKRLNPAVDSKTTPLQEELDRLVEEIQPFRPGWTHKDFIDSSMFIRLTQKATPKANQGLSGGLPDYFLNRNSLGVKVLNNISNDEAAAE